ncbi:MAG TPA: ROK family protein [Xanthobacteraceae bacterium]|nr:ROK family protein [Xanthobacteraceae bacterium]
MRTQPPILVADIGGTKTRIALGRREKGLGEIKSLFNDRIADLQELLSRELAAEEAKQATMAVLAVAAPIDEDRISLTNRAWSFSRSKLKQALKLKRLIVVNDFVAVAHALPALTAKDVVSIGGGKGEPGENLLACGPGTGFGVAALVRAAEPPIVLSSEAGHMVLGAASAADRDIFARLAPGSKPLVIESILSGPGLARLHQALCGQALSSNDVIAGANAGGKTALETVEVFLRVFGRVAGDLALAFNARGGVYLAGGLGRGLAPFFAKSSFRKAFEEHPTYGERLAAIPTRVIVHPSPELLGAFTLGLTQADD